MPRTSADRHVGPVLGALRSFLRGSYVEGDRAQAAFDRQHERDEIGTRVHLALAMFFLFFVGGPTSYTELAGLPVFVYSLIRLNNTWRTMIHCLGQPVVILLGLWAAWQATSLAWSPDPGQGLGEIGSMRWIWVLPALWPVIDRRRFLIAALAGGFIAGNIAQALHVFGREAGIDWLVWPRFADRNSGWWDPVVGGSVLVGALGLHLPAALGGRGRTRWLGLIGAAITLAGILATGTRGAWLAAGMLLVITVAVGAARVRPRRNLLVPGAVGAGVVLIAVLIAWLTLGESIAERYRTGRSEIARAIQDGDYSTDTGARINMWIWGGRAWARHPIVGVGAGGYRAWTLKQMQAGGVETTTNPIHDHAHSAPIQIAATTGLVGLTITGLILLVAVRGGLTGAPASDAYALGPGVAIVGLALAGLFDSIHLNAQTGALMATLLALCLYARPTLQPPPWQHDSQPRRQRPRARAQETS